ncbi:MAG TPA: polymer-forming cytoskeletal protein [Chthoniobacterales bacterium]
MARRIRKISADCPKCGHRQSEPEDFISTLCQGCGETFHQSPRPPGRPSAAPLFKRPPRLIHCHRCGRLHEASPFAEATSCPQCNSRIQLGPVRIESHASRVIDTRGDLTIGPEGYLNTTATYCTNATIHGRISGFLLCEKTLTLDMKGRCQARIEARSVIIERHAELSFYFPIRTHELIVRGRASAVVHCSGGVWVKKTGQLEGEIRAHSFQVDKGGRFQGRLAVNAPEISPEAFSSPQREFPFLAIGKRGQEFNPDYTTT